MNPLVERERTRAITAYYDAARAGHPVTGIVIAGRLITPHGPGSEDAYWQALAWMDEKQAIRSAYGEGADDDRAIAELGGES